MYNLPMLKESLRKCVSFFHVMRNLDGQTFIAPILCSLFPSVPPNCDFFSKEGKQVGHSSVWTVGPQYTGWCVGVLAHTGQRF